jgi:hypothetical protein
LPVACGGVELSHQQPTKVLKMSKRITLRHVPANVASRTEFDCNGTLYSVDVDGKYIILLSITKQKNLLKKRVQLNKKLKKNKIFTENQHNKIIWT